MTTHYEDGITFTDANCTVAGNFIDKLMREHDIESLDIDLTFAIAVINAATEISWPWAGWELRLTYDDVELVIPMMQLAALQNFWYENDEPPVISSSCWTDAPVANHTIRGHFRLKVNCPAASGKFLQVQIRKLTGEAAWSETAANTAGTGVYTFNPIYGSFDRSISCQYVSELQFANARNMYPASVGDIFAGAIFTNIVNSILYTVDGTAGATNTMGANMNAGTRLDQLKLEVGDMTLVDAYFNPRKFQRGLIIRSPDTVGALGTGNIACLDYIIHTDVACKGATVKATVDPSAASDVFFLVIYTSPTRQVKTTVADASQAAPSGGGSHTAGPKGGGMAPAAVSQGPVSRNLR